MRHATAARNELGPLLDHLIRHLGAEGSATQQAHFKRIRGLLYGAADDLELTRSIFELTSCTAMGFRFSHATDVLVRRILSKTSDLVSDMQGLPQIRH